MNTVVFILSALPFALPVLFATFGEWLTEKAGMLGIHTEGMMLAGAFTGVYVTSATGSPLTGALCGMAAAVLAALIFAGLTLGKGENAVVVGTGVNLLVLGLTGGFYRLAFGDSGKLLSVAGLPLAYALVPTVLATGILLLLHRTHWGLQLRASGEDPSVLAGMELSPIRIRLVVLLIAALFAGFGGAFLSLGLAPSFAPGMTAGRGFVAIALVAFGRWRVGGAILGAILVGASESLSYLLQSGGTPPQLLLMIPYALTLGVLLFRSGTSEGTGSAPASLGKTYERRGR